MAIERGFIGQGRSPLRELVGLGQSPWLDFIRRSLLATGELERMIVDWGLRGITSNAAIFEQAIAQTREYDGDIAVMAQQGMTAGEIHETLIVQDVQRAADLLMPVHEATDGADGFVSLDLSPHKANDAGETIAEAKRLWSVLRRPNVMLKVPATEEGLTALRALLAEGINVNVTLLFCVKRYRDVASAYLEGLEAAASAGRNVARVASVASFFLSRIDVAVDRRLDEIRAANRVHAREAAALRGEAAIASARRAYVVFEELVASPRFRRLAERGARPQRLLWASTGRKDPAYDDIRYIEALIGADTVSTMPLETMRAYHARGRPEPRLAGRAAQAAAVLDRIAAVGVDLDAVTSGLLDDGIAAFIRSRDDLLEILEIGRQSALGSTRADSRRRGDVAG